MAVILNNLLKFDTYHLHIIDISSAFSSSGLSFQSDLVQTFSFDFSGSTYSKLFKIVKFPNSLPTGSSAPFSIGGQNGVAEQSPLGGGSTNGIPLFENFSTYSRVSATEQQHFAESSIFELFFTSTAGFSLAYWSNKNSNNAFYPLVDFPSTVVLQESFRYRHQALASNFYNYRFRLALYFARDFNPDALLYI